MAVDIQKQNKVVVVTGITGGLGYFLAQNFMANGSLVVGCGTDEGRIVELDQRHQQALDITKVNVADFAAVKMWSEDVLFKYGSVNLLIQCAGVVNEPKVLEDLSPGEINDVIEVNLLGVINCAKAFLPAMKLSSKGMIINISSGWGREAKGNLIPYCASKFGVEGFSQALADELPESLKVFALDPGDGIQTKMLLKCLPQYYSQAISAKQWAKCAYDYIEHEIYKMPSGMPLKVDLSKIK